MRNRRVVTALIGAAFPALALAAGSSEAPAEPRRPTAAANRSATRASAPTAVRMIDFLASSIGTEQETLASPHVPPGRPEDRPPGSPPGQSDPPNPPGKPSDRPPAHRP